MSGVRNVWKKVDAVVLAGPDLSPEAVREQLREALVERAKARVAERL